MANTIKDYIAAYKRLDWAYAMAEKFDELDEDTRREVYDIISEYETDSIVRI